MPRITHYFDQHDIEPLPGTVLEWDPPRQVSFTWAADTISFQLAPAPDGGTVFVLTEELSANHAARNAAGWEACLDRLQLGVESEAWQPRYERYVVAFEPILGQQDGPPAGYHPLRTDGRSSSPEGKPTPVERPCECGPYSYSSGPPGRRDRLVRWRTSSRRVPVASGTWPLRGGSAQRVRARPTIDNR